MSEPIQVKLSRPVQWSKDEPPVGELVLTPTTRAFRELKLETTAEGRIIFEPYKLAEIGVRLAGKPSAFLDKMAPCDMSEVAQAVMSFLAPSQPTGGVPSP